MVLAEAVRRVSGAGKTGPIRRRLGRASRGSASWLRVDSGRDTMHQRAGGSSEPETTSVVVHQFRDLTFSTDPRCQVRRAARAELNALERMADPCRCHIDVSIHGWGVTCGVEGGCGRHAGLSGDA